MSLKLDAIVLAGGRGTRLQSRVSDKPKPLAPIAGRPFLEYLLKNLEDHGITHIVLSVGYMHEKIISHFGSKWRSLNLTYCIEDEPLGTGGAIQKAMHHVSNSHFFILNGDSILDVDLQSMWTYHRSQDSELTLALKQVPSADRYGTVVLEKERIVGFQEKGKHTPGEVRINGGVYLTQKGVLEPLMKGDRFSFETDTLPRAVIERQVCGYLTNGFFIDIGISEDFDRAQSESYLKGLF